MELASIKSEMIVLEILIAMLSRFLTQFLHFAYVVLTQVDVFYSQNKKTPAPDSTEESRDGR
jgi:hypothetical protein